jgi:hypothetical protein
MSINKLTRRGLGLAADLESRLNGDFSFASTLHDEDERAYERLPLIQELATHWLESAMGQSGEPISAASATMTRCNTKLMTTNTGLRKIHAISAIEQAKVRVSPNKIGACVFLPSA